MVSKLCFEQFHDSNFATHVAGCLAEAPIDGLCKEYSGKSFSGYTDNYIGMMPYWDVSAVTNMSKRSRIKIPSTLISRVGTFRALPI